MRTEARCHPDSPRARGGSMDGPQGLGLLLALLSLCITAGTPEVWARVQREATAVASFTVHCGFLGSGSISLVTVSWGGPDGAGGTRLAVLHPEFGTQLWVPAHQAQWETRSSISLTLEAPEGTSPSPNTTFCCKFVSFPEGSQEACRDLLSTDQGLPAPTPAPFLQAGLAGILGVSGVLLLGCGLLLYLLLRERHWAVPKPQPPLAGPQAQVQARALQVPYTTIHASYSHAPTLDLALRPHHLSPSVPLPASARRHHHLSPLVPLPASARGSFISVENRLYARAGGGPPQAGAIRLPFPGPLEPRAMEGCLGVR
ncbi:transmembrane protein PVRIG isoform X2 [Dasypus novemcinctus]|uniref:transmembrane protein PVRIG isoform X2 n=1 Tax=Dasypus novemcinctus TaxID=9361 RepID=UPI00265E655B|nr:transmembrane protein PVRIG isoform X2 [Dasypus novemcinctus]